MYLMHDIISLCLWKVVSILQSSIDLRKKPIEPILTIYLLKELKSKEPSGWYKYKHV